MHIEKKKTPSHDFTSMNAVSVTVTIFVVVRQSSVEYKDND